MPYSLIQHPEPSQEVTPGNPTPIPPATVNLAALGLDEDTALGAPESRLYSYSYIDGSYDTVAAGYLPTKLRLSGAFHANLRTGTNADAATTAWNQLLRFVGHDVSLRYRLGVNPSQRIGLYRLVRVNPTSSYNMGERGLVHRWSADLVQLYGSTAGEVAQGNAQLIITAPLTGITRIGGNVNDRLTTWATGAITMGIDVTAMGEFPWPLDVEFAYESTRVPSNKWSISKLLLQSAADTFTVTPQGTAPIYFASISFWLAKGARRYGQTLRLTWAPPDTDED